GLLGMVVVMVIRYGFDNPTPSAVYSPIHGVIYMVYLVVAVDLALKARWSVKGTIGVLLAGCVPFFSFVAERAVTRRVAEGRKLCAAPNAAARYIPAACRCRWTQAGTPTPATCRSSI